MALLFPSPFFVKYNNNDLFAAPKQTAKLPGTLGLSADTGNHFVFGHLGLVFIWSCFVSFVLLNVFSGTCRSCRNPQYRACSHGVTAAMLGFQNKGMAAMMVYQTNPLGFELYFYANSFFCFSN